MFFLESEKNAKCVFSSTTVSYDLQQAL